MGAGFVHRNRAALTFCPRCSIIHSRGQPLRGRREAMFRMFWQILAAYLAAVNLAAFAAFGVDKWKAVRERWRIPEPTLLGLARARRALGGLAGRRLFDPKARKARFYVGLPVMLALHLCILGALLFLPRQ